jgi:hypothetical protein
MPFFFIATGRKKMITPSWARGKWSTVLPDDALTLIHSHVAAMTIQAAWRRFVHFAHARRSMWAQVRVRLTKSQWRRLIPFADVRREWRTECHEWLQTLNATEPFAHDTINCLIRECERGLWGCASTAMMANRSDFRDSKLCLGRSD